jgi:hypothetical protein
VGEQKKGKRGAPQAATTHRLKPFLNFSFGRGPRGGATAAKAPAAGAAAGAARPATAAAAAGNGAAADAALAAADNDRANNKTRGNGAGAARRSRESIQKREGGDALGGERLRWEMR